MKFTEIFKVFFFMVVSGFFGLLVPKNNEVVILASSKGMYFNGNSKALYNYLTEKTNLSAYFFIRDKYKFLDLKNQGIKVKYHYSISGLVIFLRARTVCITHGHADFLGYFPNPWQTWIHLDHGGGTKSNGFLQDKLSTTQKLYRLFSKHLIMIAKSDFDKYYKSARGYKDPRKIYVTGFPRMDTLYNNNKKTSSRISILFAPTYIEKHVPCDFRQFFGNDILKLKQFLQSNNAVLYIRFHPNNYQESKGIFSSIFDKVIIDVSPDQLDDIQDLLPEIDILITDYSSISRDFLFCDRPMIFLTNNIENTKNNCLPIRYEFAFCGYKVNTPSQLFTSIQEIIDGEDQYGEIRNFVKKLSYNHIDNGSCERVTKLIIKLSNNEKYSEN